MNLTFTVPDGSKTYNQTNLLCAPPQWNDYLTFYFSNYVAHAATVIATPGQGNWETFHVVLAALLIPGSGISRAIDAIRRRSIFEKDQLKRAVRAGAMCMVVRADIVEEVDSGDLETGQSAAHELPQSVEIEQTDTTGHPDDAGSEKIAQQHTSQWWNPPNPKYLPKDATVHGQYHLPKKYRLTLVPPNAAVKLVSPTEATESTIASSYNIPKVLISFVQAIWAIITLYRARGAQIERYGYAAFGLTVAPYAFMSIMNIVGNFLNPEYPAIYLVRTPVMEEAERDSPSAFFAGDVRFQAAECAVPVTGSRGSLNVICGVLLRIAISSIPLAVVGGLSRFQAQKSTSLQRGFTLSWLVVGVIAGVFIRGFDSVVALVPKLKTTLSAQVSAMDGIMKAAMAFPGMSCRVEWWLYRMIVSWLEMKSDIVSWRIAARLVCGVAAIGGLVVVGQMISEFGMCTRLD